MKSGEKLKSNILSKLDVKDRTLAAVLAIQYGMVD